MRSVGVRSVGSSSSALSTRHELSATSGCDSTRIPRKWEKPSGYTNPTASTRYPLTTTIRTTAFCSWSSPFELLSLTECAAVVLRRRRRRVEARPVKVRKHVPVRHYICEVDHRKRHK